jgi:integrase
MGVYLRKQTGKWCWEIPVRDENGKRKMLGRYDYENKDTATLAWIEAKKTIKLNLTHLTLRQACINRLAHLKAYATHPTTFPDNKRMLSRFAEWADLPLEEITQTMVSNKIVKMAKELGSNNNANKHLTALKAVFSLAVKNGYLAKNPCVGIAMLPVERKPKIIPERDQVAQVLLLAKPMDRSYLTVVRYTAARINEINRLTWDDVDFERGAVRLWTNKKKGGNRKYRWVPVINKVMESLRYAYQNRTKNSPYVFTNPTMVERHPANPEKWCYIYRDKFFKTLCRKAGVPEMGYHTLRHLTASEMAAKGASLTDIQKVLGHERATTTDGYLQSLGFVSVRGAMLLLEDDESYKGHTTEGAVNES